MGMILGIYCPDCKKTFNFQAGIGMLPLNQFFLEELPEDTEIMNQLKESEIEIPSSADELIKCESKIYYCKNCHQIKEFNYFKFLKHPSFTPKRICPDCSNRMKYISNIADIANERLSICCPECKKEIKSEVPGTNIQIGFWD